MNSNSGAIVNKLGYSLQGHSLPFKNDFWMTLVYGDNDMINRSSL